MLFFSDKEADSKSTSDQLSKGFSNVLKRKKKYECGASEERQSSNSDQESYSDYDEADSSSDVSVHSPKPKQVKKSRSNDEDAILAIIKQRQEEKSKESHRLGFFKSLMYSVDSLTESQFMGLQMDFIQALQARTQNQCESRPPAPAT